MVDNTPIYKSQPVYYDLEDDIAYISSRNTCNKGVGMSDLLENQKCIVIRSGHLKTLHALGSLGGLSGIVLPPYRVVCQTKSDHRQLRFSDHDQSVFCHRNLSEQNVIVDLDMPKSMPLLTGSMPDFTQFPSSGPFYTRFGLSVTQRDNVDNYFDLLDFFRWKSEALLEFQTTSAQV